MARTGENIYKRKDGRWEGRFIKKRRSDGSIHYGYVYAYTYPEVRKRLLFLKATHQNQYVSSLASTFHGSLEEWGWYWLADIKPRIKLSTYASYVSKLTKHVFPSIGQLSLTGITPKHLQSWINQLTENLSSNSVRVVVQVLRMALKHAVVEGLLVQNPCQGLLLPKRTRPEISLLTPAQQQRLYNKARETRKGLPIVLALEAGLRIGEIGALRWRDIDFASGIVTVRRTVQRIATSVGSEGRKTRLVESSPKSESSQRQIPLSATLLAYLKRQVATCPGTYVLHSDRPCDPRTIFHWFRTLCQTLGLPSVRFHSLRHGFATRCIEKGVSIATTSALLGHSSIKMTLDTYVQSFLADKRKAIQRIRF